jgi:hypothetical protein
VTKGDPVTSEAQAITTREAAERLWDHGQQLADRLDRLADEQHDEAERERLGDLADSLRGI